MAQRFMMRLFQEERRIFYPNATSLRRNPLYYQAYCIALNTCFATLFPLVALLYFNVATLLALRRLGRQAFPELGPHDRSQALARQPTAHLGDAHSAIELRQKVRQIPKMVNRPVSLGHQAVDKRPQLSSQPSLNSIRCDRRKLPRFRSSASTLPENLNLTTKPSKNCLRFGKNLRKKNGLALAGASSRTEQDAPDANEAFAVQYHNNAEVDHGQIQASKNDETFPQHNQQSLLHKNENRLTRISLSIVWLFIFCHVWKLIPTIYELLHSKVSVYNVHNSNVKKL